MSLGTPPTTPSSRKAGASCSRPDPVRRGRGDRRGRALLASHPPVGEVRDRDPRPHPEKGRDQSGAAARYARGPLETGVLFKTWLAAQRRAWRDGIESVAMDGFTGYRSAAVEELHHATMVMDPFPRRPSRGRNAHALPVSIRWLERR